MNPLVRFGLPVLLLASALSACDQVPGLEDDGGFEKVSYRERENIPAPAFPAPPPVIAGAGGGGGAAVPTLAANVAPPGVTQEMVEQGAELYGTICSACHGPAGAGTPAAPSLQDGEWINVSGSYDEIINVIHSGVPNPVQFPAAMPPLGGGSFDDEQVRALAAYVFALANAES